MIYFALAESVPAIKIGFVEGDDANGRIAELQVGSPVKLTLLGTIPGTKQDETDLHRRFAALNLHGEWFRPEPELLAIIPQKPKLQLGKVSVEERRIEVRALTINKRQMTTNFIRQLAHRSIIAWQRIFNHCSDQPRNVESWKRHLSSLPLSHFEAGVPWGWIMHDYVDEANYPIRKEHLVWDDGKRLYLFPLVDNFTIDIDLIADIASRLTGKTFEDPVFTHVYEPLMKLSKQLGISSFIGGLCRSFFDRYLALDRLFIGV
jgi:hypothetical protein